MKNKKNVLLNEKRMEIIQVALLDLIKTYTDTGNLGDKKEAYKISRLFTEIDDFMRYEDELDYPHTIEISIREIKNEK